jgi:glycerol-3-phosphate O-acyltransferase
LIDDYLAETGKNRYIITDDEFSRIGRLLEFFRKILVHEGSVIVRFGRPLDPFGNDVTDTGDSIDRQGRIVDPASFVRGADGEVSDDDQRDAEYTRALGRRLAAVYPKLTVFHATHLVARAVFDAITRTAGTRDIYRLIRVPPQQLVVGIDAVVAQLVRLRKRLADTPAWGAEHPMLRAQDASAIVDDAVRGLSSYHTRPIVSRHEPSLQIDDVKLLYYYQNRTAHVPPEVG